MNNTEQGITLLESMITLIVLSVGLLGTSFLMVTGLKHSNGSFIRTEATMIAENIVERIRANPDAIETMDYVDFDSNTITNCSTRPDAYCQQDGDTLPDTCTSTELATFDLYRASCGNGESILGVNGVKELLPSGQLLVVCNEAPCTETSTYTIRVNWNEIEFENGESVTNIKSVQHVIRP